MDLDGGFIRVPLASVVAHAHFGNAVGGQTDDAGASERRGGRRQLIIDELVAQCGDIAVRCRMLCVDEPVDGVGAAVVVIGKCPALRC